jgi:hypothetical protein
MTKAIVAGVTVLAVLAILHTLLLCAKGRHGSLLAAFVGAS